ncbi:MAG: SDR family oxidoreductase [Burkholderiales bacterium]
MQGKICLVTGASSGIGKQTAIELAARGAQVVLLCRSRVKGEAALDEIRANGHAAELMLADLSSQNAVRRFAAQFKAKYPALQVLINNAGTYEHARSLTEDGIETTFAVNYLSAFLLTHLLLDALKAGAPARIINVSSATESGVELARNWNNLQGEKHWNGFRAYALSKQAQIQFTRELAQHLEGSGVTVNCLHPGAIATDIYRNVPQPMNFMLKLMLRSPEVGARTPLYLACAPELENVSGKYFEKCREANPSPQSQNREAARKLWQLSEKLLQLS